MTRFRPCIDLHNGCVKQIVGGTLTDDGTGLRTNFVAEYPAEWFAARYKQDGLRGGHVIKLGPGNDSAARAALAAYPGGLQIGGGITPDNAEEWLAFGASHVIVTSVLFDSEGRFRRRVLRELVERVGRERLVLDLSCRRTRDGWVVAMNRWQTLTELAVTPATLSALADTCDEFLIHAADVLCAQRPLFLFVIPESHTQSSGNSRVNLPSLLPRNSSSRIRAIRSVSISPPGIRKPRLRAAAHSKS